MRMIPRPIYYIQFFNLIIRFYTVLSSGIMRYMIPVVVPKDRENVFLCVNELKYCWTEGVGVLWDDTYPHKVYNNTDEIRVVIYMDVVRPLSWGLNALNLLIIKLTCSSKIVKDEIKRTEIHVKNS